MEPSGRTRHALTKAGRGFVKAARIVTALLFVPFLILFLKMSRPDASITGALKVPSEPALIIIITISLIAAVDSLLLLAARYRRLAGFPVWTSLNFAAASLNIVMACHWLISLPLSN